MQDRKIAAIAITFITALGFTYPAFSQPPAFPGAEGAGKYTIGGRGGKVYEVTNLNDSGPGSFRAAAKANEPRIVVFRVSGTIALQSHIVVTEPYMTIAGQTAPGDGICLKDSSLEIDANEIIIRFLRLRLGNNAGGNTDSIQVGSGTNIILDHCSTSWGTDETVDTYTDAVLDKVTVQWCFITEGLNCSGGPEGCHGMGSISNGCCGMEQTYHHNLYAHHAGRSPYPGNKKDISIDPDGFTFDFRNNVIYNWGNQYAGYNEESANSVTKMNFVGNYYKAGPNSTNAKMFFENTPASRGYFSGNWMNSGYPSDPWSLVMFDSGMTQEEIDVFKQSHELPVSESVTTDDAQTAYQRVLAEAGAILPKRDAVDKRIVNDVINGTGRIIDDESQVGGWPSLSSGTPPVDSDHDGMPDAWEIVRGLNPNDANDGSRLAADGSGYTNVEEYLNYLVASRYGSADLNADGSIGWGDLGILAAHWLNNDCNNIPVADLNLDCDVDFVDFAIMENQRNQPPVVDAGSDQQISLSGSAVLNGTVTYYGPDSITTLWTRQSGPGTVTFTNPNATVATASFSAAGTYVLRLTASDGQLSSYDEAAVITGSTGPTWGENADYYVDGTSGNDGNAGTSSSPWATLAKAVSTATSGKKVLVWGNQTYSGALTFSNGGASSSSIIFKRDPTSGTAIIDGAATTSGTLSTTSAKYIVIDGFTIQNGKYGLYVNGSVATGWTIRNCRITGNTTYGIYVRSGTGFSIFNDAVYGNGSAGTGIYFYNSATNSNVTQCDVYKHKYGIEYDNSSSGTITNSIVTKATSYGIYNRSSTVTVTYSDVWSNGTDYSGATAGAGCINGDPKFTAPDSGDFHLQSGSPAHNTASDDADMGYRYSISAL